MHPEVLHPSLGRYDETMTLHNPNKIANPLIAQVTSLDLLNSFYLNHMRVSWLIIELQ